jgi:transposase
MPLGYEIIAGNRNDATTLEEIVEHIEGLYGRASRIRVMDRGMAGEHNVEFLREGGRRYIVGTAKNSLVDVALPTRSGTAIRKRCISQPTEHRQILLQRLGLKLPTALESAAM